MKNKILSFGALLFTCFMVMAPPTSAQSDTQSFKTNSTAVGMESQQLPAAYNNSSWTVVNERTNGEGEITISGIDAGTFIIPNTSTASAPEGTQATVVYDNGPHINMAGTPDLSVLGSVTLGMNTLGGNVSNSLGYGISDEFELVAETEITGITAYAYQTGASSTTINAMYVTIWDGDPSGGGSVVWGDQTTDVFDSVEDINAYRVAEDDQGGRTRMLQKVKASISGLTLAPGTYWLEYSLDGTSSSGPWQPPIVILGEATTGNALQLTPTGYQAWLDSGTNTPQGVPFQIEGIEAGGVTYCIPEGTNSSRYINNFSTTGGSENISNMGSGFSAGGYGDFYDTHTVAQSQGEDVAFEVDVEGGTAGFRIWVDWNQDGVFDTTEEVAYASNGYSSNHTGSFTVPADALEGDTRMRIVSHWLSTTGNVDPCETGFTYGEFEDYKFIVSGGGGGTAGQTCDDPIVVSTLPYNDAGNTADYGNFYSNGDVPDLAPDAVTNGTGSPYYLSGDEVVYAYTPADDEVLNISTTNDDDWIGLWAFTGCPFTSTVGYHTATSGGTRSIDELPVTAGETYYFVISTWSPPQSTDYTIHIEKVGGGGSHAYCIPEGTNSGRYIDNFSTTGGSENVSNMGSGFSPDGYGDYYDTHTVAQAAGEDVQFEVDIEGGTAGFRIWVDWNQDGVFDTTEEVAYASTSYSANHTGSFTVPTDALEGDTRMRIVSHWLSTSGDVDPCETGFTYGEFEDYKFTVEAGGALVYCIPEGTNTGRYIDNFSTTGGSENVSNMSSGFSPDGYGDFYDTHTVAQATGEDVQFEVDIEGGTAGFRIWVDWNQDGVFDTTEEVAWNSSGYSSNHTGSFTVPADALEGDTRMRIVSHWLSTSGDVDPCETGFTYGEFEDYKFTVEAGTGGGGGGPCSQGTASNNIENGWGNVSLLIYANDFVVAEGEEFTLEEMEVNFLLNPGVDIVSADIYFYEDTGGDGPGAEIAGTSTLGAVPVSQAVIGNHPAGFDQVQGVWTLGTPITFEGGSSGDAVYWMGMQIEYAGANAFIETSSIYDTPNESYFSDDEGENWTSGLVNFGDDMHGVITFSGQCEASGGGGGTACEQVL